MTFAVTAYCESYTRHWHRKLTLFGSVIVAIVLGGLENSRAETVILTNIPWCLALSMLMSSLIETCINLNLGKRVEMILTFTDHHHRKTEKTDIV
jgi:hypothetical protein